MWAVSFIATKVAVGMVPPLTVVTLRLAISAFCFGLWLTATGWPRWRDKRWLVHLILLSLLGTGLHYGSQSIGLQWTTASNASIYVATGPVIIALTVALVRRERLTLLEVAGIGVALSGVLVVMGLETLFAFELTAHLLGDLLVLFSLVTWALFTVFGRELSRQTGASQTVALVTLVGALWMLPIGCAEAELRDFSIAAISLEAWLAILFLGVACSFLAVLLYFWALGQSDAQTVGVYLYTIPPLTCVIASLYLGEDLGSELWIGSVLVIGGVYITELGPRHRKAAASPSLDGRTDTHSPPGSGGLRTD